jgi:DNA-binding transcriptional ArsR family regulator
VAGIQNPPRATRERPGGLVRPGLTAPHMPAVKLDPRTAYDFLISACDCGEPDDLLSEDRTWLAEGHKAVLAELGVADEAQACLGFTSEAGRLLINRPEIKTARQLVAVLDALDDAELLETLVGELLENEELGPLTRRAMDGDPEAYETLRGQLERHKGHGVMPDKLNDLPELVRRALRSWLPIFEAHEERVDRILRRDVAGRSMDEAAANPIGFIEKTTNGIRMVPDSRTRRIVLAPSYFGRPYNSVAKVGDTTLICYPIADTALGESSRTAPPAATVRLYRALGDETRLQILRLRTDRARYLTELATALELSKPTVSHHLAQLRSAGLVTMTEQGNLTYYTLRRDRADEAGPELRAFLSH